MRRIVAGICFILLLNTTRAQPHTDTIGLLQQTAGLYDLQFTNAEADSMINNINSWNRIYKRMHQQLPKNDLPYPFAFSPLPYGFSVPTNQEKIKWIIPAKVSLPVNRNELAYYSILQLASLIKNKKITSVDLTQFSIQRLKK